MKILATQTKDNCVYFLVEWTQVSEAPIAIKTRLESIELEYGADARMTASGMRYMPNFRRRGHVMFEILDFKDVPAEWQDIVAPTQKVLK